MKGRRKEEKLERISLDRFRIVTKIAINCRLGASSADPSNGKREGLPYKSVGTRPPTRN